MFEQLELGFPVFPFFSCSCRTRGSRETVCMNSIARCASKQVEKYLFFVRVFPELLLTAIVGNTYLGRDLIRFLLNTSPSTVPLLHVGIVPVKSGRPPLFIPDRKQRHLLIWELPIEPFAGPVFLCSHAHQRV